MVLLIGARLPAVIMVACEHEKALNTSCSRLSPSALAYFTVVRCAEMTAKPPRDQYQHVIPRFILRYFEPEPKCVIATREL